MSATMARPPGWRLGDLLPGRGYSRCYRCHKPWYAAGASVSVSYAAGRAQFTMCQPCWDRSSIEERVEAHRWACAEIGRMRVEDGHEDDMPSASEMFAEIESAIRRGEP